MIFIVELVFVRFYAIEESKKEKTIGRNRGCAVETQNAQFIAFRIWQM